MPEDVTPHDRQPANEFAGVSAAGDLALPWLAALDLAPESASTPARAEETLRIATRLAVRAQRIAPTTLLLALGRCTAEETCALGMEVLGRLVALEMPARIGIAPTVTLARLALVACPPEQRLRCVAPEEVPSLLATAPVAWLGTLGGGITADQIARLEHYGLRTLGHLARLHEATLRQQFGRATGTWLAATAHGRDLAALHPTPLPERVALRLRLAEPLTGAQLRAGLPALAERAAVALMARRRAVGGVTLEVVTEAGVVWRIERVLAQSLVGAGPLARLLEALLEALLAEMPLEIDGGATRLTLALERLVPALAGQTALWPAEAAARRRAQQAHTAAREVAERLRRRHGRALLLQTLPHAPDAIFSDERYRREPLTERAAEAAPTTLARAARQTTPSWAAMPVRLHWW
jgi:hypothetical protein